MLLCFTARCSAIAKQFLAKAFDQHGSLDKFLRNKDENGNNFMHLVECRFAPQFWTPYI